MGSGSEIIRHHMRYGAWASSTRGTFSGYGRYATGSGSRWWCSWEWNEGAEYDRLGIDEKRYTILDQDVPFITVPVRPGRNIPIIIETAALNHRLKKMGVFSARELDSRIQNWMRMEGERPMMSVRFW